MATPETVFVLNPYDQELDLSKRELIKLYTDGCVGLLEKSKYYKKRENYSSFVKVIGKKMERFRTKTCLNIATELEASGTSPELVTEKRNCRHNQQQCCDNRKSGGTLCHSMVS